MARFFSIGIAFLCFIHNFAWAKIENAYFVLGKSLVLGPPGTFVITSVEWRHNDDIAAEWTGQGEPEYYRNFKGKTVLETKTGVLKLRDMTEAEAGLYSVEINGKRLEEQFSAKAIEEIGNVEVWLKPKVNDGDRDRELDCNTNAGNHDPVTYWWDKVGNGSWFEWGQKLLIQNNETTQSVKTFSCKISNPVGESKSKPVDNPFYIPPPNPALAALVLIPIALVVGAVIAWKKGLFEKIRSGQVDNSKENVETPLQGGDGATPSSDKAVSQ